MNSEILKKILEWPIIVQGALGSAIFWMILRLFSYLSNLAAKQIGLFKLKSKHDKYLREYIYQKYTSSSGLFYYTQGYFLSFKKALEFLLQGILFLLFGFLLSFLHKVYLIVGLIGAIYYAFKSLSWILPYETNEFSSNLERWERIAQLEKILFGKAREDTLNFIKEFSKSEKQSDNKIDSSESD